MDAAAAARPGPCARDRERSPAWPGCSPRSRGLSEHGAFSCEERCIPAHMQGWGYRLEEDCGQKCQRWVVTRDAAWRCEHDDCNIAVFTRTLSSILHSPSRTIPSSDA